MITTLFILLLTQKPVRHSRGLFQKVQWSFVKDKFEKSCSRQSVYPGGWTRTATERKILLLYLAEEYYLSVTHRWPYLNLLGSGNYLCGV